jgi:hypothetical protein
VDTLEKLRGKREKIWISAPDEVRAILKRRDINQPAGNLLYVEALTRDFAEFIWLFAESIRTGEVSGNQARKFFSLILENLEANLRGMYGQTESASVISSVQDELLEFDDAEFLEVVHEVRLYLTRLNMYFDKLLPWNEFNEVLRSEYNED